MIGIVVFFLILAFGLQVMVGRGKPENIVKFLVGLIFLPVLISIGYSQLLWVWSGLPLWLQMLSLALVPFGLLAILRMVFPKAAWMNGFLSGFFNILIYAVTFPFRFAYRAIRLIFERETRRTPLDRYRPAVGGRPPIQNSRREGRGLDR